jgi:hypothetical protein
MEVSMRHLLSKILRRLGSSTKARSASRTPQRPRLELEALEGRLALSGFPGVRFPPGSLSPYILYGQPAQVVHVAPTLSILPADLSSLSVTLTGNDQNGMAATWGTLSIIAPTGTPGTFQVSYTDMLPGTLGTFTGTMTVTPVNLWTAQIHFRLQKTDANGCTETVDYQGTLTQKGTVTTVDGVLNDCIGNPDIPPTCSSSAHAGGTLQ